MTRGLKLFLKIVKLSSEHLKRFMLKRSKSSLIMIKSSLLTFSKGVCLKAEKASSLMLLCFSKFLKFLKTCDEDDEVELSRDAA